MPWVLQVLVTKGFLENFGVINGTEIVKVLEVVLGNNRLAI